MEHKVEIDAFAEQDIAKAIDFYNSCESGVGDYFFDCIATDIASLKWLAGVHREEGECFAYYAKRFPYKIFYRVEPDFVRVVAVLDMRQHPSKFDSTLRSRK